MKHRPIQTNEVKPGATATVTITLPVGIKYESCTAFLITDGIEIELGKVVSWEPWRRIDLSPADVFDAMTAAGFKLNLITGDYERTNHAAYPKTI